MSRKSKGPAYYAVVTLSGSAVVRTWDEAQDFLKQHPGAEFHKKFPTEDEAWGFVELKRTELSEGKKTWRNWLQEEKEADFVGHTLSEEPHTRSDEAEDDDAPPW